MSEGTTTTTTTTNVKMNGESGVGRTSSASWSVGENLYMRLLTNDGTYDQMRPLIELKAIFSKQLPKMPPEYIVRLVFDRKHESLALFKGGKVVGGICFRPCQKERFAEIVFCAVTAKEQVKGFGSLLMNHLKHCVQKRDIRWFLTYADNFAVGYFQKQGFCRELTIEKKQWEGYLKDYDGATLLQCEIHPTIDFTNVPKLLQTQREHIYKLLGEMLGDRVIYEGDADRSTPLADPFDIPGVRSAGWTKKIVEEIETKERAMITLQQQLGSILSDLKREKFVWPYLKPVEEVCAQYPIYREVIKDPIDLKMIEARVSAGLYTTKEQFRLDIQKMCDNCKIFNPTPGNQYYETADQVTAFVMPRVSAI